VKAAIDASYYPLSAFAAVLLFVPLMISRLGFGTKRWWHRYAIWIPLPFLSYAYEDWRISDGSEINISVVLGFCSFVGGALAESTAGRMRRF